MGWQRVGRDLATEHAFTHAPTADQQSALSAYEAPGTPLGAPGNPSLLHKVHSHGQYSKQGFRMHVISALTAEVPGAKGTCRLPRGGSNFPDGSSRENFIRHQERKSWSLMTTCAEPGGMREGMINLTNWKAVNAVKTHVWGKTEEPKAIEQEKSLRGHWPLFPISFLSFYKKNTAHEWIRKSDFKYWLITWTS